MAAGIMRLAVLFCALGLAACVTPATTAPNTVPLEFGMTPQVAAAALGAPLVPVSGRPGSDILFARLPAATPGLYRVDGLLFRQFRNGRLTGWKKDWRIPPHWI
jgi:hypothetical protein